MNDRLCYEVVVVGGGPAGLTTALYTTRLGHRTAVFEKEGGRHATVSHVHNLYGISEDVSGQQLAKHAVDQLLEYGGDYYFESVGDVRRSGEDGGEFLVEGERTTVEAERIVFATGFTDRGPSVPELLEFTGRGLHYCLHCDAYLLGDGQVFVLGHDDHAAEIAMVLLNFTPHVDLLVNDMDPEWSDEIDRKLRAHPVERIDTAVDGAFGESEDVDDPWLGGLTFADGTEREYLGGFAVYGREYTNELPESVGCELADDGAVLVDDTHRTSVEGVYAVGDLTHGQNQTVIAMGDGAKAGIALHKELRRYPRPGAEPGDIDKSAVPDAADEIRARMRLVRERETHRGLRGPSPDQ